MFIVLYLLQTLTSYSFEKVHNNNLLIGDGDKLEIKV